MEAWEAKVAPSMETYEWEVDSEGQVWVDVFPDEDVDSGSEDGGSPVEVEGVTYQTVGDKKKQKLKEKKRKQRARKKAEAAQLAKVEADYPRLARRMVELELLEMRLQNPRNPYIYVSRNNPSWMEEQAGRYVQRWRGLPPYHLGSAYDKCPPPTDAQLDELFRPLLATAAATAV